MPWPSGMAHFVLQTYTLFTTVPFSPSGDRSSSSTSDYTQVLFIAIFTTLDHLLHFIQILQIVPHTIQILVQYILFQYHAIHTLAKSQFSIIVAHTLLLFVSYIKYHTIAYGINSQVYHDVTLLVLLEGDIMPTLVEIQ